MTTAQYAYVLANAGRVPAREIRRTLKVSKNQLEAARRKLNREGAGITLRCFTPKTSICPACGCARVTADRTGICEPCRRARQLAAIEGATGDLMALLPEAERRTYEETEAEREGRLIDPPPARRSTRGLNPYERAKAEEEWELACERWQTARLNRLIKAAQKRKERIARKVRESAQFDESAGKDPKECKEEKNADA